MSRSLERTFRQGEADVTIKWGRSGEQAIIAEITATADVELALLLKSGWTSMPGVWREAGDGVSGLLAGRKGGYVSILARTSPAPREVKAGFNGEVDLNALWSLDALYLAKIAEALGKPAEAQRHHIHHVAMNKRINDRLWNDELGIYCSRNWQDTPEGKPSFLGRITPMNFYPLACGAAEGARRDRSPSSFSRADPFSHLSRRRRCPSRFTSCWTGKANSNFPMEGRGSDGWHALATWNPEDELLHMWTKDNF